MKYPAPQTNGRCFCDFCVFTSVEVDSTDEIARLALPRVFGFWWRLWRSSKVLLEPQHGFHVFFLHSVLSVSPWVFSWAWVKIPTRLFGSLLSQVLTLNEPFKKKILNTAHKAILTTSSLTHWVVRTTTGFVMILQKDSARRWILVSWLSKCKKESTHTVNQHFRESTWFAPMFDEWTRQKERRASIGVWKARLGRQHEISMSHIYTIGVGNSNVFYFHPWGTDPIWLAHIFQMAWWTNHQLDTPFRSIIQQYFNWNISESWGNATPFAHFHRVSIEQWPKNRKTWLFAV